MTADDFRRIALELPGVEESSHHGAADFRVDGRMFATLAHQAQGFGNLMLNPEIQEGLLADAPDIFVAIQGGWGRLGHTHIRLAQADEATLAGALRVAWKLRCDKNQQTARKSRKAPGSL
jgi:hypothetical protein